MIKEIHILFTLYVVRFPYISSNMPNKMFYSTISAEILRITRATKRFNDFSIEVAEFLSRMIRQGAKIEGVRISVKKLLNRHFDVFKKYSYDQEAILNKIINLF